ncbi:hypothetical protein NC652_024803 [Populus alba x Populus x berolinensis]|nr:hypothetical protein NC652_024803 [Populus alba x Populus x berolinensis]
MPNDYVAFSDHLLCGLSVKLSEPFLILDFGCSLLSRYYIMICCIKSDIPAPLATKVYYSQRNTRLRSAVAYLYHATSAEGLNMVNSELSQESIMQLLASSQKGSLDAQTNDLINEKGDPSVHQPDEILAQSSEMCLDNSGGFPPLTNFSNQVPVDNILRPQTASVGMLRSKYLSKPYSFAGNSVDDSVFVGQSLGTMQQPNGTVPVL